jgi:molybdopterin/thiamine biosynthesis adenylyltransferase
MLTEKELERYKRQMMLPDFGREAQEKLKNATIVVAGIGGLGGTTAFFLAAAGVGRLIFVHEGKLTESNLNRQILMKNDRVGESRVDIATETLREFNPHVQVEVYDEPVRLDRMTELMKRADLLVDARHNFPERRILNQAAVITGKPMVEAAMNSMEATLFNIFPGETACLHCVYPENQEWDPFGFAVLGAQSGSLGCMAAVEAVKIITGCGKPLRGSMLYYDLAEMEFRKFKTVKNDKCPVCGSGA